MFSGKEIENSRKQFMVEVLCFMTYLDTSVIQMSESIVQNIIQISIIEFYKRAHP